MLQCAKIKWCIQNISIIRNEPQDLMDFRSSAKSMMTLHLDHEAWIEALIYILDRALRVRQFAQFQTLCRQPFRLASLTDPRLKMNFFN